jgi:hypothetical protein
MAKVGDSSIFEGEQGPGRAACECSPSPTAARATTSGSKKSDGRYMAGFKLRVPPVDTFRAMASWGARRR